MWTVEFDINVSKNVYRVRTYLPLIINVLQNLKYYRKNKCTSVNLGMLSGDSVNNNCVKMYTSSIPSRPTSPNRFQWVDHSRSGVTFRVFKVI